MNSKEERCAQLSCATAAIASCDPSVTRVLGNYLLDHGVFAQCAAYRRGWDLLRNLADGEQYPVIVLDERLLDMIAEEFVKELSVLTLSQQPAIFVLTRYRYLELCENLSPYGAIKCIDHMMDPARLTQAIRSWCSSFAAQIPDLCEEYYRQWGVQDRRRDCTYLTQSVCVVLNHPDHHLLRKQVLSDVALRHGVELSAVESGLQRMIRALEAQSPRSYQEFLDRHALHQKRVTPIRLINAMAAELNSKIRE